MSRELISFSDMLEYAIAVSQDPTKMLNPQVLIQLLNDWQLLFNVISKGSRTLEKGMKLYIAAAKDVFRDKIISSIGVVQCNVV